MNQTEDAFPKFAVYILGAGFSRASGLPLAAELWREVLARAVKLRGRAEKFREDLDDYLEFRLRCFGENLTYESVDFEQFLGHLDIEFHLGLRGSETWSRDGNEGQVVVKTLLGQILTEATPRGDKIKKLYVDFARKLRPYDIVFSFNYDILLERALELASIPYRLYVDRFKRVSPDGFGVIDSDRRELTLLKVHGSVDWFDRQPFLDHIDVGRSQGLADYVPAHPVFNPTHPFTLKKITDGPRMDDDLLREMYRVGEVERLYAQFPWFQTCPALTSPSSEKVIFASQRGDFFRGLKYGGQANFRMVVIGYSLPPHDRYARQVLYHLIDNYQNVSSERFGPRFPKKEPLLLIDTGIDPTWVVELRRRYAFVNWDSARLHLGGFGEDALNLL